MISLLELLNEEQLFIYEGLIRVSYSPDVNVTDIEDIIRGIEGVTIVASAGDSLGDRVVYKVKIRTFESDPEIGEKLFINMRQQAIKHEGIQRVEIATKTIRRV